MSEPLAWLAGVRAVAQGRADGPAHVERRRAQPRAVGLEGRLALEAVPRRRWSGRGPAPSPSRRWAGRRGCPSAAVHEPARARPGGAARSPPPSANSTRPPRLSPATWPRRQPCARARRPASRHRPALRAACTGNASPPPVLRVIPSVCHGRARGADDALAGRRTRTRSGSFRRRRRRPRAPARRASVAPAPRRSACPAA